MARKRMIDPAIWESEQVQQLTGTQFKLYVFLISTSDDEGRFKVNWRMMAAKAFPLEENYRSEECRNDMLELYRDGLIDLYHTEDHGICGRHPNWHRYQAVPKPQPSSIPETGRPLLAPKSADHEPEISIVSEDEPLPNEFGSDIEPVQPKRKERKERKESSLRVPDGTEPPSLSALKDPLADRWQTKLTERFPPAGWSNVAAERKACNTLARRTAELIRRTPLEEDNAIDLLIEQYGNLRKSNRSEYWRSAQEVPSHILTRWSTIVGALAKSWESQQLKDASGWL